MSNEPCRSPKRRDAIQTRAALIAAATQTFARYGYEETNLRQVCAEAGANLGAVRHYFGTKEALYQEVLVRAHRELVDRDPIPSMTPGDDPARALHAWVHYLLRIFLLRRSDHPHAGRLIAWELREPTPALDALIAEILGPVRKELERIVAALLGDSDDQELRARCANFIHGICVFHDQNRKLLQRLGSPVPSTEVELVNLADDIVAFAVAGIGRLREERRAERLQHGRHAAPPENTDS
ncbi:MAG TPA: CerR family C-terminal domain-containing protein [Candidatus Krumholzibacteria bacterium]|nr:CerR family C-terminal domain-containing protein [Candidatus Krumholzibacteria bacterium]